MPKSGRFASLALSCVQAAHALQASARPAADESAADATEVTSLAALPVAVREQLAADLGDISDRGGPFNPGCIMKAGVPSQRFVRARVGKDVARVEVEQGGIAHYVKTLEFRAVAGSWKLVRRDSDSLPIR